MMLTLWKLDQNEGGLVAVDNHFNTVNYKGLPLNATNYKLSRKKLC